MTSYSVIIHEDVVKYLGGASKNERGIRHTTCAQANLDTNTATPAEIAKIPKPRLATKVDSITNGLAANDKKTRPTYAVHLC